MKTIFLLLAMLTAIGPMAHGCRCGDQETIQAAVARSAIVFIGRVTKLELSTRKMGREVLVCEFKQVQTFKGEAAKDSSVSVITSLSPAACGFSFRMGQECLVYAWIEDGELWTDSCSRTRWRVIDLPDQNYAGPLDKIKSDDAMLTEVPKIKAVLGNQ